MNELHPDRVPESLAEEALDSKEPQQRKSQITQKIEAKSIQSTGLLPHPVVLEQYNRILPNASDRIISMAEKEQEHRHKMQEKLIDAQILDTKLERNEKRLEQIFGLSISIVSILSGSVTAISGFPWAGGVIGSAGVVGLVSVFVLGRREQDIQSPPQLKGNNKDDADYDDISRICDRL